MRTPVSHIEVRLRLLTVSLLAIVLVACDEPDTPMATARTGDPAVAAPTPPAAGKPTTPSADRPTSPAPRAAPGRAADPSARLALDGEGLRAFSVPSGASRLIAFGQPVEEVMRALEVVLGVPPLELGDNLDCGARLALWPEGLTTWFASDRFVGWSAGSDLGLSSAGGMRVGMSRRELENGASSAHIAPSTLGTEFESAGMGGLLDSAEADAKVSHLWAGATCIAR